MSDKLFERALKNKCPICNELLKGETETVKYNGAKLEVHKEHIKFKGNS